MEEMNRRKFVATLFKRVIAIMGIPLIAGRCKRATSSPIEKGTGYVYDDRYLEHEHSTERWERLVAIQQQMILTGLEKEVKNIAPIENPVPCIENIHSQDHITGIRQIPNTGWVSELAVAGVLGAVKAVYDGEVKNAFCAIRPPGHHAHNAGAEEGFCFYNNVAIAARSAMKNHIFLSPSPTPNLSDFLP